MSKFRDRYEAMSTDELINVALTSELLPEAEIVLRQVLVGRGVSDLTNYRKSLKEEIRGADEQRESRLAKGKRILRVFTWIISTFSFGLIAYGIYELNLPSGQTPKDDGGMMIIVGIVCIVLAVAHEHYLYFWWKNVMLRRPPYGTIK